MDKASLDQGCFAAARGSNQCYKRTVCYLGHELMGQVFTAEEIDRFIAWIKAGAPETSGPAAPAPAPESTATPTPTEPEPTPEDDG